MRSVEVLMVMTAEINYIAQTEVYLGANIIIANSEKLHF